MNELTVKYRGKNVIEQQSRGHSDAIALMFTMKSGGVDSKQDNPKVTLIGESADASLTITTDISDPALQLMLRRGTFHRRVGITIR